MLFAFDIDIDALLQLFTKYFFESNLKIEETFLSELPSLVTFAISAP